MNGYFVLLKNIRMSLSIFDSWLISINIQTVRFCVKAAMIIQWRYKCVPDSTYIESMFVNLIKMSPYNEFPIQTILYRNRHGCRQGTLGRLVHEVNLVAIVATPRMEFTTLMN